MTNDLTPEEQAALERALAEAVTDTRPPTAEEAATLAHVWETAVLAALEDLDDQPRAQWLAEYADEIDTHDQRDPYTRPRFPMVANDLAGRARSADRRSRPSTAGPANMAL
jgi:hypothetical protein